MLLDFMYSRFFKVILLILDTHSIRMIGRILINIIRYFCFKFSHPQTVMFLKRENKTDTKHGFFFFQNKYVNALWFDLIQLVMYLQLLFKLIPCAQIMTHAPDLLTWYIFLTTSPTRARLKRQSLLRTCIVHDFFYIFYHYLKSKSFLVNSSKI